MRIRQAWPAGMLLALLATTLSVKLADSEGRRPAHATSSVRKATADWPAKPREVAQKIAAKYGAPDEVTPSMLIWHQRGPWKRTIVYREEVPHSFPKPHTDIVEQFIDYRVPSDKFDELAAYDGSVIVERTKGEISARCDDERMNLLAINLAHDIVTGNKGVAAARKAYAEAAQAVMANQSPPYTQALQFKRSTERTADPDQPMQPEMAAQR